MEREDFGPYRLEELIGRGGMGEVYRAVDTRKKDRVVALKRLPAQLASNDEYQDRFRREAEIASGLREPHIIPIHDYGEIDGQLFIDMRLVDGVDLATVLKEHGPLPPDRTVEILAQVAAALDAAHACGLIHRDVKPSNVLLTGNDGSTFVYLVDFGIARPLAGTTLTGVGATVGSPHYMAPERFVQSGGDHSVDIYSLGCVLHQCLTGLTPFPGKDLVTQMYAHIHRPPPRPSAADSTIPAGLDNVVARAMAKDPNLRYRSAGALATAARSALPPVVKPISEAREAIRPRGAGPTPNPASASSHPIRTPTGLSATGSTVPLSDGSKILNSGTSLRNAAGSGNRFDVDYGASVRSSPDNQPVTKRRRTVLLTLTGIVVLADLFGIGALLIPKAFSPPTFFSKESVATTIQDSVNRNNPGASLVLCPQGLKAEVGATVRCEFQVDGQPVDSVAKVTSIEGNAAKYDITTEARPVSKLLLEKKVGEHVSKQTGLPIESTVCSGDLQPMIGRTATCTVTGRGDTHPLNVVVTSVVDGLPRYKVAG